MMKIILTLTISFLLTISLKANSLFENIDIDEIIEKGLNQPDELRSLTRKMIEDRIEKTYDKSDKYDEIQLHLVIWLQVMTKVLGLFLLEENPLGYASDDAFILEKIKAQTGNNYREEFPLIRDRDYDHCIYDWLWQLSWAKEWDQISDQILNKADLLEFDTLDSIISIYHFLLLKKADEVIFDRKVKKFCDKTLYEKSFPEDWQRLNSNIKNLLLPFQLISSHDKKPKAKTVFKRSLSLQSLLSKSTYNLETSFLHAQLSGFEG